MAQYSVQEIVIKHDKTLALLGSAIEALFITHQNKEELARVFKERCDLNFSKMAKDKYFEDLCRGRDNLIKGITKTTVDG